MTSIAFEEHRTALTGHCYRMLGSVVDAEDAVQEAFLKAWRNRGSFRGDSSERTWLYRIATNVCLDSIASSRRRHRPVDTSPVPEAVRDGMPLERQPREHWVEPIPDAMALPAQDSTDPEQYAVLRESIRLAFVAALQYLPPRQRAVLLLTQVLNWSAAEAAESLGMTVVAVNSALQRARATLAARNPTVVPRDLTAEQRDLLERYEAAFLAYDVEALTGLLHEEVTLSMPPFDLWLRGHESVATWFLGHGIGCRGSVLMRVEACGGMPAFAQYRAHGDQAWAIILLELDGDRIRSMTSFLDVETLFPRFGLPLALPRQVV
ncbi:MAG TPA: sigma-70 family RNA polymerase sigma factor [Gemmatimonadales bacterium]|nr:sigma-70 family RNA polymerase sigma factor [Gemmatimonadales bacterium]